MKAPFKTPVRQSAIPAGRMCLVDAESNLICETYDSSTQPFIATAINSHEALVEALEAALKTAEFEGHGQRPWQYAARAALALAKGEPK